MSEAAAPARLTPRQWAIILTAAIAAMLEVIDVSITNVALTQIQASLGATLAEVGWVVTGYAMASVIMIPLSEWLSELFGQRTYFLACLVGFTASSVLCGLAPNLAVLVLARILQGLLGGGLLPKAQAIMFQAVPKSLQGLAQGVFGIVVLAGPALGPTLGGYLTDGLGWRWIFFVNLPFGILTVLMALACLPPDTASTWRGDHGEALSRSPRRIDWIGILLLAVGLGSLQLVLEQGHQYDWFENQGLRQLALLAAIALPAFVWWELRRRDPAVDLRVLRHRSLAAGSVFSLVLGMGLYGTIFVVPIFAQTVLQYTATQTGLLMLPGALASALTMAVLGKNSKRFDPRLMIVVGAVLMVGTMAVLSGIGPDTGEDSLYWPLIFRGVTTVMMFLPLSLATLGPLPREDVGAGSGFYNLTRQLGGTFGIAVLTVVLDHQRAVHRAQLVEHLATTNPLLQERLQLLSGLGRGEGGEVALQILSLQVDRQAALLAYGDVFRVVGLVFLLAIPLVLLLGKPGEPEFSGAPH
ncbi:MAG: DHA2 family efflux MFS transporter permease subunit [Synechococcaceae bacterium WB8_1B_136]|nr:DHA2 family efflux MFS transporter permease subunit [Synechococcaceae bacterium WB8_1B_136]